MAVVTTLAVAGGVSVLTGAGFFLVARALLARHTSPQSRGPHLAHATWWAGLGAYLLLQGTMTIAASMGQLDPAVYRASRVLAIPLLAAATWGITFYLVYLYTGRASAAWPLAALYGAVGALFVGATFSLQPDLVVTRWLVSLDDRATVFRVVYVLFGAPPILSSVAYLSLLSRVREPLARYRIRLVAGSILAYVLSGLAARLGGSDVVVFVTLVIFGLGACAASLAAYYPPAWVRARLEAA